MKLSILHTASAAALAFVATVSHAQDVTGASASFPAPVYAK